MTSISLSEAAPAASPVAKKINRTRVKSAYRDALYRPLFQAVAALQEVHARGGTSVTYSTPSHPLYSIIRLDASYLPTTSSTTSFKPEPLSDEDVARLARFWSAYAQELPHLTRHKTPARWRDLSDVASLEWLHQAMRHSGAYMSFTLNLSPDVEAQAKRQVGAADWISKRIARNLKAALGRKVDFWFAFEVSEKGRLHVHGELGVSQEEGEAARKALRLAGGEWDTVRQHQAKTVAEPTLPWTGYCAKQATFIRPLSGRLAGMLKRPIKGDWLFATNGVRTTAGNLYEEQRKKALFLAGFLQKRN